MNRQKEVPRPAACDGLVNIERVAELLAVSPEHTRRLNELGSMPRPVRLGRSVRWRISDIREWIAAGCPDLRRATNE